jgi:hypothetical protein
VPRCIVSRSSQLNRNVSPSWQPSILPSLTRVPTLLRHSKPPFPRGISSRCRPSACLPRGLPGCFEALALTLHILARF